MAEIRQRGPHADHEGMIPPLLPGEYAAATLLDMGGSTDAAGDTSSVMQVPTLLMRTLLGRSRDSNLPMLAPEGFESKLHRDGIHFISRARTIYEAAPGQSGVQGWVRAYVQLRLRDDSDGNRAWCQWLDFDAPFFGKLVEAGKATAINWRDLEARTGPSIPEGYHGVPHVSPPKRWVGTHAYAPIYARLTQVAQMQRIESGQREIPTVQVMAASEASMMHDAHVLCVDPAQVAVLPEWADPQEPFDYAEEMTLPFEPLFLDFSGPGNIAPRLRWEQGTVELHGALVWRNGDEVTIAPYGDARIAGKQMFEENMALGSLGWFVFGRAPRVQETGEVAMAGTVRLMLGDLYSDAATIWADACATLPLDGIRNLKGYAVLPRDSAGLREIVDADEHARVGVATGFVMWGELIWKAAVTVLAALSITEAVEVEIVDAPMEKRVLKRALKRKWPIAQQVVIAPSRRRYEATNSTGEKAHYSHRFWRRATVAHYPIGTRIADARPDLVTPCKRPLSANCGFCRKVKHPAVIVGPDDRPLVLKTLARRA